MVPLLNRCIAAMSIVLLGTAACSSDDVSAEVRGPLLVSSGDWNADMAAIVQGRITLAEGCLHLGGYPVIWPEGTTWDADAQTIGLPGGDAVALGSEVAGGGGYLNPDAVGGLFGPDFAAAAQAGLVGDEVAVFNPDSTVNPVK